MGFLTNVNVKKGNVYGIRRTDPSKGRNGIVRCEHGPGHHERDRFRGEYG